MFNGNSGSSCSTTGDREQERIGAISPTLVIAFLATQFGVGFIIGIIQDSLETAINSSGDVIFAATAEYMEWKKEGREIKF